ncbi:hypothetical protein KR52_07240 [Synechococcus sp. KORDI-52]|nr:hypothetical protein KR52_07240 [Synechococcus sp. KORDI-52]
MLEALAFADDHTKIWPVLQLFPEIGADLVLDDQMAALASQMFADKGG